MNDIQARAFITLILLTGLASIIVSSFAISRSETVEAPLRDDELKLMNRKLGDSIRRREKLLKDSLTTSKEAQKLLERIQEFRSSLHDRKPTIQQTPASSTRPRFATAYVVGGVDPDRPAYRGYIYDILVSTYIQRKDGSKADTYVFFQLSFSSQWDSLPEEDVALLNKLGIKYEIIPKDSDESFSRITLNKFRILNLTQYERVLFLDGDVMARRSLDYLFELSVQGLLKPNVVITGRYEPANAGFFIVAPKPGAYKRLRQIVTETAERGRNLPYPHFDPVVGWGHAIEEPDYYSNIRDEKGYLWDFHCKLQPSSPFCQVSHCYPGAFADQGLLYHWVKYEEKSVSIIGKRSIEDWGVAESGNLELQSQRSLSKTLSPYSRQFDCWKGTLRRAACEPPFSDFVHFTGRGKPWLHEIPANLSLDTANETASNYWYFALTEVNHQFKLGLNLSSWEGMEKPLLGLYPKSTETLHIGKTAE